MPDKVTLSDDEVMTIIERAGIEMDTPAMAEFWTAVSEFQDSLNLLVDCIIDHTVRLINEQA
jgi:hypothetical protein